MEIADASGRSWRPGEGEQDQPCRQRPQVAPYAENEALLPAALTPPERDQPAGSPRGLPESLGDTPVE